MRAIALRRDLLELERLSAFDRLQIVRAKAVSDFLRKKRIGVAPDEMFALRPTSRWYCASS